MNREKLAWIVSLLLAALLAFAVPSGMAQRDDDYAFVRTLVDIHRQVVNNYVEKVDETKLENGAIDGMLNQLDPYSVYVPPQKQKDFDQMLDGSFEGVGIQLKETDDGHVEVATPIDGSPAAKAGVLPGDIILKVNGVSIEGMSLPDVIKQIKGKLNSEVTLHVRHEGGVEADLKMTREEVVVPTVKGYLRNPDNSWDYWACDNPKIAYLRITQFTPDTYEHLRAPLEQLLKQNMQGMILDLRWNPGGRLDEAIKIVNLFISHGTIVSTKGRNRPENIVTATPKETLPPFPMVVLVNEHSASASEIVSGSLMDNHRAIVVGTRTYGKGSVQELMPLEGNSGELKLTVAYYYLPSGRLVHKKKDATDWGVDPQIVVPMDEATEHKVMEERSADEMFTHPRLTTHPTTAHAMVATTQPIDTQLQAAVSSLMTFIIFQNGKGEIHVPATEPVKTAIAPSAEAAPPMPEATPAPAVPPAPAAPAPEAAPVPASAPAAAPATAP